MSSKCLCVFYYNLADTDHRLPAVTTADWRFHIPISEQAGSTREEQVRYTLAQICHFTDAGDYDAWTALFVEGGSFHLFGNSVTGRAALRKFIEEDSPPQRRGLHLTTDSIIRFQGDSAHVASNFIFVAAGAEAGVVVAGGRYHDVLVPCEGRWLFLEREAELFGPTATLNWGGKGTDQASMVPWFAVTRATPPEHRGKYVRTEQGIRDEGHD